MTPIPARRWSGAKRETQVQKCITSLDEEYREVLVLRDIQGFSYEEIRDILKIPDGTVKSRLSRARNALKDCLTKVIGDFMKNCKEIENNLSLYLDDSLSDADKKAVEEHLKSCPRCTKALVQLSKTHTLVNNLAEVEPPAWFKQKIMAKVRKKAEKKSFVQKLFYPLRIKIPVQILATVFIAVLAVYIYRAGEEQMKEVVPSSAPAPIMEVQKSQLPEQKMKTSANENIQKEDHVIKKGGCRGKKFVKWRLTQQKM